MDSNQKAILQIVFALIITIGIFAFGDEIKKFESLGYIGVFIISLISAATVVFPAPGWIIVLELGRILDPFFLSLSAGIGASLGELTGYFAGSGIAGIAAVKNRKLFKENKKLIRKYDVIAIFLLAAFPLGIFDFAGIAAGTLHMDVKKFLIAAALGNIVKFFLIASLGLYSLGFI